ncbi:zinc finger CW-type PWWP domain protein 1 [Mus musculus]|uniref:Zinc finger CW-type PWWP domain protein 1 n=1 Tax=Mus musculus TaxID=10090 RepID=ZCPW1_MOUSE|nr:zinc finger CW-type PWWP domain protein 1 [Mus musculus]NP_001346952.1 zinc finger CW-type PWWP domain protein 1 [Mus musculus]Q6IR42.2 RecName: Full=Zinc finger CW-type PWWP domain protein 1 [Mus musculus]AAX39493.1 ZCWPW1 [Mus musculus]|eukprot:NP_001005426.2 zinc finger CW-type PWWP domain protein 1 [Mus musculus]
MMAALQTHKEYEKGTKKTFAPPTQKLHSEKPQPSSWKEDAPGTSSPEAETKPSLLKASLKKEQKPTTEHGPNRGQERKLKAQDQPAKKKGKERTLTSAEFEEIFQIVLQKSLQECLETSSCVQHIRPTKLDEEPGIVPPATDKKDADPEKVITPDTPKIASSLEEEVNSEMGTSKLGQPVTEPSKKKFNRLSLSKQKKKAEDEKMEKIQDGRECSLKEKQKIVIQDQSQIRGPQKEEESGFGHCVIWVQCSSPKCEKWRQLRGNIDPSVLPDDWSCDQNPDPNYNRCDIPEESWAGCESDVAYASYVPGSIIWAKQYGYPWWPGMIEADPDLGEYFLFASHLDSLPSKYHVTFFGETVSRAWIPVRMLKNFQELSLELVKKCKNKNSNQKLEAAIAMAHRAEQTSIQERVNLFGFWSRYNGADISEEGEDLTLCESNNPESCLEKEEKDLEEEKEEEEEKKDPTLPRPKPAKMQTKKPKSRGPAGGPDGTPKKKTAKKSLVSESTVPPVPTLGGKEEQGNSDLDHPVPKKKFKAPENKTSATNLSEEKEIKIVSKCPTPSAQHGACPLGKEGLVPHMPPTQEAASFPPDDDCSSDLDLEQLMEDIGEPEERGEMQQRGSSEEFLAALFEE